MRHRSIVYPHPEITAVFFRIILTLIALVLVVPGAWAGTGHIVRYDNPTHLDATFHYLGVEGGGINCWSQMHLPDSECISAQTNSIEFYTEDNSSGACFTSTAFNQMFALLAETADGRQRTLQIFNTGFQDCYFHCPLIQTAPNGHLGQSELFLVAGGDYGAQTDNWSHQALSLHPAGGLPGYPYSVASALRLDGENLTGSSRHEETVYKVRVTAPRFLASLGVYNNRLLETFEVEGSNDKQTWDALGRVLPSNQGVLETASNGLGSTYGTGDAVFYYQPTAEVSFRYLQVSQCTLARDLQSGDPTCSSSTIDLEGLEPPYSHGNPPDLSQITIALEPVIPQGGSEAAVVANALAQEAIQVTLFERNGNPIHPDNPTLGQLYDLLYFLDFPSGTLVTNFHSKQGFNSLSDLEGPYTTPLGATENDPRAKGPDSLDLGGSGRVVPPSTYYFTTTMADQNQISARLRIDDQVVCPPGETFEGGSCQASITGKMPTLAIAGSPSTTQLSFNNSLAQPSQSSALLYVADLDQDSPVVGVLSEYEVFYYCPDDTDQNLERIGATSASASSSDAKTLVLDSNDSCCKTFATTVIDVHGTSLAPRAAPASCTSEPDFGTTGTWGSWQ